MIKGLRGLAAIGILAASTVWGADWPQFRGPNRDGICTEKGLLQQWPEGGPKLLWQMNGLGKGFASLAIVNGKAYTGGDLDDGQYVMAIDLASQKIVWKTRIGPVWTQSNDPGSRSTPTVDGDVLYYEGAHGDVACIQIADGKEVWHKNLQKDFGGKVMSRWGYSESPLVDGEKVIVTPGAKDAMVVALNKKTGETIWKCDAPNLGERGNDGAGYVAPILAEIAGVKQYVTVVGRAAIGVAAADGKLLWSNNKAINNVANITSPVVKGDHVFITSSYNTGSALLKISADGDKQKADVVYFLDARTFNNHHGGVVLVGEHIYGGSGQNQGIPTCIQFQDGKIAWQEKKAPAAGSAAVLYADGNLIFRYERGAVVALIAATPEGYQLKGQFKTPIDDGPAWAHPVIVDGKLYLRTQDSLMVYNVKQ